MRRSVAWSIVYTEPTLLTINYQFSPFLTGDTQCECTSDCEDESKDESVEKSKEKVKTTDSNEAAKETSDEDNENVERRKKRETENQDECSCECKAYNFKKLTLAKEGTDVVVTNGDGKRATVLIENILASNGVIHLIDKALY